MAAFVPVEEVADKPFVPVEEVEIKSGQLPPKNFPEASDFPEPSTSVSRRAAIPEPGQAGPHMAQQPPETGIQAQQPFPTQRQDAEAMAKAPTLTAEQLEELAMSPQATVPESVKEFATKAIASGIPGAAGVPQAEKAIKGLVNLGAGLGEFATAPAAGPIMAAQMVPGLNLAIDATMAASMAKSGAKRLGEASVSGDMEQITQGLGELVLGGLVGAKIGKESQPFSQYRDLVEGPSKVKPESPEEVARKASLPPPTLLPESRAELNKLPGGKDAIQERSPAQVPVEKPPGDSATVGKGIPEQETPAVPRNVSEQQPQPPAQTGSAVRDVSAPDSTFSLLDPKDPLVKQAVDKFADKATGFYAGLGKSVGLDKTHRVVSGKKLWEQMTPQERYAEFSDYAKKDFEELESLPEAQRENYMLDRALDPLDPMSGVYKILLKLRGYSIEGDTIRAPKRALPPKPAAEGGAEAAATGTPELPAGQVEPAGVPAGTEVPGKKWLAVQTDSHRDVQRLNRSIPQATGGLPIALGGKSRAWQIEDTPENRAEIQRLGLKIRKRQSEQFNQRESKFSETKPEILEAPTTAAAKVETQVQEVARTEGQRQAKEVKSELVARLEDAVKEAPSRTEDYFPGLYVYEARTLREPTRLTDRPVEGTIPLKDWLEKTVTKKDKTLNRNTAMGGRFISEALTKKQVPKITIDIPGDGSFTVWNTKDALGGLLERAKRISTKSTEGPAITRSGISKEDKEGAQKALAEGQPVSKEIIGMGGAVPTEFDPTQQGTVVSNMFAAIDQDRAALGKPPMEPGEPRTWDQDQQIATAKMNRDPMWIPSLIKEVLNKPRPLLSWEQAGMVLQKAYWKAEANNALRRIANAVDSGLAEEELVRARTDAARFEDAIEEMEQAVGRGGTGSEAGRTLQAQKMGLTDDLTLVEMRLEARGKLGGRKLFEHESAKVAQIHKEYEAKIGALEKATSEADKRRIDAETRATLAEVGRQTAEAKVPPPHVQRLIDRVGTTIHERANAARERLKGKLFSLSPDVLKDLAEIGADNIWTIGEDFGRWSAKMVADIGEKVRPHLQAVWEASKKLVSDTFDAQAGPKAKKPAPAKVVELAKQTIKKGDTPAQQRTKLTARIVDRFTKNELDGIAPAVQKLARTFVEEGIRDREALIDAVHGVLADVLPDWTRRQTMDAISGYGVYKTLSKDEISVRLRDLKGQMQQIAKLEDMAGGEAPLRTGLERREVTKAQSELIKLVNEAKREGGYETTDPTRQLRTALDEVKKRTQTTIDDYQRRIAEKDYGVRKPQPIRPDSELLNKQAELKRTRQKWEQQKREWELGQRNRWQRLLDRFVRWERAFKLSSPVVFGKLAAAAVTRFAETAATEVAGGVMGLAPGIRQVARQAPREGGLNVKAMAKGFIAAWRKGMNDAAQTLTRGAADIDVMYGEKLIDKDWANFFGQLHGMMKAPVKRFEFELSLIKRTEKAIRNGLDPSDPLVSARLHAEALNDGYRSIFMQRGFSSDMFNQLVSQMEKSKKYPIAGEVSARLARFLLPVVRVPANIVAETATGVAGGPVASMRTMFHAVNGTLGNLDPVVADSIMRQFKKGAIGLGLMAVGYFNPQSVGGYDWRERRTPGTAKTAGFQIGGVDIPRWLTHAPWFELMQIGATIRHVKDQHVARTGAEKGIGEGLWAAGLGLIEETPFVGQMLRVDKIFQSPAERTYYLGELAKGTLVPQVVIKAAELADDGTQRKPQTIMEHVKMGIPGLREDVAVKPPPKPTRPTRPRPQR